MAKKTNTPELPEKIFLVADPYKSGSCYMTPSGSLYAPEDDNLNKIDILFKTVNQIIDYLECQKYPKIQNLNIEKYHAEAYDAAMRDFATEDEATLRGMKHVIYQLSVTLNKVVGLLNSKR